MKDKGDKPQPGRVAAYIPPRPRPPTLLFVDDVTAQSGRRTRRFLRAEIWGGVLFWIIALAMAAMYLRSGLPLAETRQGPVWVVLGALGWLWPAFRAWQLHLATRQIPAMPDPLPHLEKD